MIGGAAVLIALDTKRADVYAQTFSSERVPLGEARAVMPDRLVDMTKGLDRSAPLLVAGDAAHRAIDTLGGHGIRCVRSTAPSLPDTEIMAATIARRWQRGERPKTLPSPLYLRAPSVTAPGKAKAP